jgi:Fe-S-cluster-containing dehydrogenase component
MKFTRREFVELSGACLVALSGRKVLAVFQGAPKAPAVPSAGATARKRLGILIDTAKCLRAQNCTRCIEACDRAHNIPDFQNPAHQIKWIWEEPFEDLFAASDTQYLEKDRKDALTPVMCNQCDDPPCVRVCPTGATWKREADGIVMMDWHRCIGCRYCMAACPYGSRSFNWVDPRSHLKSLNPDFPTRTQGVVEKCTFCAERLDQGKLPACVEACPEKAMVFGDLNDPQSEIRKLLASSYALRRKPELGTGPNVYYLI